MEPWLHLKEGKADVCTLASGFHLAYKSLQLKLGVWAPQIFGSWGADTVSAARAALMMPLCHNRMESIKPISNILRAVESVGTETCLVDVESLRVNLFFSLLSLFCFVFLARYRGSWVLWRCTGMSSRFWITAMPTCRCSSTWVWSPRLRHWELHGQPSTARAHRLPSPPSPCCLAPKPTPTTIELCTLWGSVSKRLYVCCTESVDHSDETQRCVGGNWD